MNNDNIFEFDACDVTPSVYPHRAGLKNMPGHGGNRTYDLWIAGLNCGTKLSGWLRQRSSIP